MCGLKCGLPLRHIHRDEPEGSDGERLESDWIAANPRLCQTRLWQTDNTVVAEQGLRHGSAGCGANTVSHYGWHVWPIYDSESRRGIWSFAQGCYACGDSVALHAEAAFCEYEWLKLAR